MPAARATAVKALHRLGPPTLIILGSLWLLQSVFAHTKSHGVIIQNLNYDAGNVKAGSTVTDTVRLINMSSVTVMVDAQPGCGCTVANLPNKPLSSMSNESVRLEIDTEGMKKGLQSKAVLLTMQSGNQVWTRLAVIKFKVL